MQSFKTLFFNRNFLPARDLVYDWAWALSIHTKYPFAPKVVVIGDKLTYLKALFTKYVILYIYTFINISLNE